MSLRHVGIFCILFGHSVLRSFRSAVATSSICWQHRIVARSKFALLNR